MHEPFSILLELVSEGRLDPWEIDIARLMDAWLRQQLRSPDLRTCGRGVLSASTLLRLKSDGNSNGKQQLQLIDEEEVPELPDIGPLVPMTYSPRPVGLGELLDALKEAIAESKKIFYKKTSRPRIVGERIVFHDFEHELEKHMRQLLDRLHSLPGPVRFSDLLTKRDRSEIVRLFLLLVFLASEQKVSLVQLENDLEVKVKDESGC